MPDMYGRRYPWERGATRRRTLLDEPGILASADPSLLSYAMTPLRLAGDVFEAVDAPTRAGVGYLLGADPTGESNVTTGEDLLRAAGWSSLEGNDTWAGFLTEAVLSPWNLLGIGGLTKAGKAAAALSKAERGIAAVRALPIAAATTGARKARLLSDLKTAAKLTQGGTKPLAKGFAQQAAEGSRSLLSFAPPFTSVATPIHLTGGRVSRLAGQAADLAAAGLDATVGRLGRTVVGSRQFQTLADLFRIGARVDPNIVDSAGHTGADLNDIIDAASSLSREGHRIGGEQFDRITRAIESATRKEAGDALATAAQTANVGTQLEQRQLARIDDAIANATDPLQREALLSRKRLAEARMTRISSRIVKGQDPRLAALAVAIEQLEAPSKIAVYSQKVSDQSALRVADLTAKRDAAAAAGDTRRAAAFQGAITREENKLAALLDHFDERTDIARTIVNAMPPNLQAEARRVVDLSNRDLKFSQAIGGTVSDLMDPMLSYLHRAPTPRGLEFARIVAANNIDSPAARFARQFNTNNSFAGRRTKAFDGLMGVQINDYLLAEAAAMRRAGIQTDFGLRPGDTFFVEDPSEAVLRRLTKGGRFNQANAIHAAIVKRFAIPVAAAERGDVPILKYMEDSGLYSIDKRTAGQLKEAGLHEMVVPRDMAEAGLRVHRALTDDEEIAKLGQFASAFNSMMRFAVTVAGMPIPRAMTKALGPTGAGATLGGAAGGLLGAAFGAPLTGAAAGASIGAATGRYGYIPMFPGYTSRNAAANMFMAWLAGMQDPRLFRTAARMQFAAERAAAKEAAGTALTAAETTARRMIREATDLGGYGHVLTSEIADISREAAGSGSRLLRAIDPQATRTGKAALGFNQFVENNAKLALYLDGLKRGLTKQTAADRVKRYLFDYSELSHLDKRVRRWAFFYTWTRKAIPLMLEELYSNPAKMRLYTLASGQNADSTQAAMLREFQRNADPMLWDRDENGDRIFLSVGLPPEALSLLSPESRGPVSGMRRIGEKLLAQTAPPLRAATEFITGRNLSSGQPAPASTALTRILPISRALSLADTVSDALAGRRRQEAGLSLLGITASRVNPQKSRDLRLLDALNRLGEEMSATGQARPYTTYSHPFGQRNQLLEFLNSQRSLLQRRLSSRRLLEN